MTDPLRSPGKTPHRAEPLQPDAPGRGSDLLETGDDPSSGRSPAEPQAGQDDLAKRIQQSDTALDNVSHP